MIILEKKSFETKHLKIIEEKLLVWIEIGIEISRYIELLQNEVFPISRLFQLSGKENSLFIPPHHPSNI